MANVEGRATAITVLSPYKPQGWILLPLVFWVGRNVTATLKKLQMLSFIHYARWVMIKRFPDGGDGEKLNYPYLMFESNFNGSWDQYIDAFSEVVPTRMKAIWGSSFGFPGPNPVGPFKAYIHRNEFPVEHFFSAYPHASTTEILSALAVRERFGKLASEAQVLGPDDFSAAYRTFLTDMQRDL
jgi:hypothetical protein